LDHRPSVKATLPKDEIEIQAHAFVGFALKRDNRTIAIQELFLRWTALKEFLAKEVWAIWQVVQASLPRAQGRGLPTGSYADHGGAGRHRSQERQDRVASAT